MLFWSADDICVDLTIDEKSSYQFIIILANDSKEFPMVNGREYFAIAVKNTTAAQKQISSLRELHH